jgi:hypothetical protein
MTLGLKDITKWLVFGKHCCYCLPLTLVTNSIALKLNSLNKRITKEYAQTCLQPESIIRPGYISAFQFAVTINSRVEA